MKNVNSQYFDDEQVKEGQLTSFINLLNNEAYGAGKYYNDIHIKPADCGAYIVEWVQVPWDGAFGGSFQYVAEDEKIMIEFTGPDSTVYYAKSDAEKEKILEQLYRGEDKHEQI
jgi:hypothetical protein